MAEPIAGFAQQRNRMADMMIGLRQIGQVGLAIDPAGEPGAQLRHGQQAGPGRRRSGHELIEKGHVGGAPENGGAGGHLWSMCHPAA
jgi:hypothetical protein